jgi:predicted patatin/cPLA2 family phospholipase
LRATCALPILYNRPVLLGERHCFDGGWWDHLPLQPAIDDGCTDVLVFLTEPEHFREKPPGLFERTLFHLSGHGTNEPLWKSFHTAAARTNRTRDQALGRAPLEQAVHVATFAPTQGDLRIATWTRDAARLRAAAEEFAAAVERKLSPVMRGGR